MFCPQRVVCRLLIVENFIPPEVRESLKSRAEWTEDDLQWRLPKKDESLAHWPGVDSGVVASSSSSSSQELLLAKRPVSPPPSFKSQLSQPGVRRPMSAIEKRRVERCRKLQEGATLPQTDAVPVLLPDEILHFCGENVVVFGGLEKARPRVTEWRSEASSSTFGAVLSDLLDSQESKEVLIDVSKIPVPRSRRSSTATDPKSVISLPSKSSEFVQKTCAPAAHLAR